MRGLSYNGAGCNYRNKYEIASYGSESSDSIRVQVRHYQDSYIAAEEATKGCSSDIAAEEATKGCSSENINAKNCISNSKSSENVSMSVKASSSSYSYSYDIVDPSSMYETIALVADSLLIFYFYIWNNIFD